MIFRLLNKKCKLLALLIIFILIISGCSRLLGNPADKKNKQDEKKYPPGSLTEMVNDTDNIVNSIEKVRAEKASIIRENKNPSEEEEQKDNQGKQKNSKEDKQSEDSQKQGQEQGSKEQGKDQKKQEQNDKKQQKKMPQVDWNALEEIVERINVKWNDFEASAIENKAKQEVLMDFENQLNALTEQIMARNEENTLVAANKLYSYYSIFLNLYKHMQPPEVKKVKYLVRQIIINGQKDQWDETEEILQDIENSWELAKARMSNPDKALLTRIDLALGDFAAVAKQNKINLTKIKGDIVLKRLEEIK